MQERDGSFLKGQLPPHLQMISLFSQQPFHLLSRKERNSNNLTPVLTAGWLSFLCWPIISSTFQYKGSAIGNGSIIAAMVAWTLYCLLETDLSLYKRVTSTKQAHKNLHLDLYLSFVNG
ncbi:unnamed protein product [Cuscuta epithymum]|uniref:Uncharacterized protein n=1 Tax=Cuscuta epithymum TaxID=186058 RepID=A0AAV0CK24_9ASTE|nr:unnamed protein product [Cuscuta epithymum]CAH9121839.1 unnamed protein product [Cuscuta epithymum]